MAEHSREKLVFSAWFQRLGPKAARRAASLVSAESNELDAVGFHAVCICSSTKKSTTFEPVLPPLMAPCGENHRGYQSIHR